MASIASSTVHSSLSKHYPTHVLSWVKRATWTKHAAVPLSKIDMSRRPGGRDPQKVAGIAAAIKAGKPMPPVVLVDTGEPKYAIADGYHRTLGHAHAGKKSIPAIVAHGVGKTGPWDKRMHAAKLNLSVELARKQPAGYVRETEQIKASAESASFPHRFKAASWTHLNGHPRCRICGQEEQTTGMCTKPTDLAVDLAGTCTGPGPCDTASFGAGRNWVNKAGGLPDYIRAVAHAFQRNGLSESEAISRAVGVIRNWAEGKGNVTAATRARAVAALAAWEALKVKARAT